MNPRLRPAFLLLTLAFYGSAFAQNPPAPIRLEAENAQLSGPTVTKQRAGFSGSGYVSNFTKDGDKITWTIPAARAGIYEMRVRYSSPSSEKSADLVVNGAKISVMLPRTQDEFTSVSAGKVELRDGANTVAMEKGWGYYDVDALDFVPATIEASLPKPPAQLVDERATPETRALMAFLVDNYGLKTLSGQQDSTASNYIRQTTTETPAILGGDLMDYSPSRVAFGTSSQESERLIEAARAGQIVTLSWHWNAPSGLINATYNDANGKKIDAVWYRGFYTNATTFDLAAALANPDSKEYGLLMRDIDIIAVQLKKFSDARVPVLWRPLHEADGGWFWWGAKGPESFKALWRLMFERLTVKHELHNLIWVNSSGTKADWYPGDDVVDIVGIDAYPSDSSDALSSTWDLLRTTYGNRKMLALTEFGKVPDVEKMRLFGVRWSYFMSWTGNNGPQGLPPAELSRIYASPVVLNQNNLTLASQIAAAPAPLPLAPTAANYRAVKQQIDENLSVHVLDQWFPRAINPQIGGFDQNFSENWTNTSKGERAIVYQSRLTWLAAQAAMRFPSESAKWKAASTHGADFLRTRMWDAQNGGFFWAFENGVPTRNGEKHAYGNAFAIYALAAHYRATGDKRSLELAQTAFRWLDERARDGKNKGYFEALSRDGRPILAPPSPQQSGDFIGTRYGYKSMNTHIHLLEAFAALYEVAPEKRLKSRLREVFDLVRDTIVVSPPGAMHLFFRPDWTPIPDHDSYGHDIETAYLLVEAAHALGMANDKRTWDVARSLVDHTLDFGLDTTNGGFYNAGGTFGSITERDKIWWTQAEALNALLLMHEKYGAQTPRYWNAFVTQWNFIRQHQIDTQNGGWLGRVTETGAAIPGAVKSDGWTEGYHQGRSLLNVSSTLAKLSAER